MYNLAKLLIDEPHKLERLIILFLKLLITLHVTGIIFGYDLSVGAIVDNPIPKTASAIQIIYFFVVVTAVWFILWSIVADLLLYHVIIGLLARIGKDRDVFMGTMWFIGIVSERNGRLIPKDNLISFADSLDNFTPETPLEEGQTRLKQYFLLTTVSYVVLLSSPSTSLSKAEIIIGAIILLNLFVAIISNTKFDSYLTENLDTVKRELQPLAYGQKIMKAIGEIKAFQNFEAPHKGKKIVLKRKAGVASLPTTLKILPAYHWNEKLGQEMLLRMANARKMKNLSENSYDMLLTNMRLTQEIASAIKSQKNCACISAKDPKEIFLRLEEWIHIVAPPNFPIRKVELVDEHKNLKESAEA